MFGNGISFGGLSSGIDTQSIVAQLVALERIPIDQLEDRKKTHQSQLTAIGTFKGLVETLRTQANVLAKRDSFLAFTVAASEEGVASFTATGSASPGAHTLTVNRLAAIDRWAFDGVASKTTDLATAPGQEVAFEVNGTSYSIILQQDQSTLEEIATEINELADADVKATIVNSGTGSNPNFQLVLTSNSSGEDYRLTNVSSTIAGLIIDGTAPDTQGNAQSTNNITVGSNAIAVIDGLTIERETNQFNDVIDGVTIDLEAADPSKTINFSIAADTESIKGKIKTFVDAYNEVIKFVNKQNKYSEDEGPGGELFGDSLLSSVRGSVRGALFNVDLGTVIADAAGYSTLGLVGIKSANDGTLSIDDVKLTDKLGDDLDLFTELFVDSDGFDNGGAVANTPEYFQDTTADSGLASTLARSIDRMFGTFDGPNGAVLKGIFQSRTDALNAKIKGFDDQIENKEFYLERFEANLVARFAKLEELMGGLNAQGAALQAALQGLNPQ